MPRLSQFAAGGVDGEGETFKRNYPYENFVQNITDENRMDVALAINLNRSGDALEGHFARCGADTALSHDG